MSHPPSPAPGAQACDLAGIADVVEVRDGHALLRFVKLTKGRPIQHNGLPPGPDRAMMAVVALGSREARSPAFDAAQVYRPGLVVETHLIAEGIIYRTPSRDAVRILGRRGPRQGDRPRSGRRARHVVPDPAEHGRIVGSFEHPAEWEASSLVVYNPGDYNGLGLVFAQAHAPDWSRVCSVLPDENFFPPGMYYMSPLAWSDYGFRERPRGLGPYQTLVAGLPFGASPLAPMRAAQALHDHVVPRYRRGVPGLRLLNLADAPWVVHVFGLGGLAQLDHDAASIRIGYDLDGVPIEEEMVACAYHFPDRSRWGLVHVRSFRAPAGHLDRARDECLDVLRSFRFDPFWQQWCRQVGQKLSLGQSLMLMNMRQDLFYTEARERDARAGYFDWHQGMEQGLAAQRAESFRWQSEGMGDILSGNTRWEDPSSATGQPYVDANHYKYMYHDGQGNFFGTDNPNLNPNINSDRNWTEARPMDVR